MNEDEAFIRAIVDAPGDNLPRLVYADWLDDRTDPRGPYLRAEAECVHEAIAGRYTAFPLERSTLIAGIDPLWVARVSRPPFGVCCDSVRFTERGPILATADVDEVERRISGTFSIDFRAYLLNLNGGKPAPACLPYPDRAGSAYADIDMEIDSFYIAARPGETPPLDGGDLWGFEIESERNWLHELYQMDRGPDPNPLIADMVPFAYTMHDLGYFLIGVGQANRGRVYHFRDYCHFSDDPNHLFDYTDTFAAFLAHIRPDRDS